MPMTPIEVYARAALRKLKSEPVRVRCYSVAALLLGLALAHGVISADDVSTYVAIAGLVLGVETSRAKVSPSNED